MDWGKVGKGGAEKRRIGRGEGVETKLRKENGLEIGKSPMMRQPYDLNTKLNSCSLYRLISVPRTKR